MINLLNAPLDALIDSTVLLLIKYTGLLFPAIFSNLWLNIDWARKKIHIGNYKIIITRTSIWSALYHTHIKIFFKRKKIIHLIGSSTNSKHFEIKYINIDSIIEIKLIKELITIKLEEIRSCLEG